MTNLLRTVVTAGGLIWMVAACSPCLAAFPQLPLKFEINWQNGVDLPWEYNAGSLGVYGDKVAFATGFGRNVPDSFKQVPGYYDGYHRLLAVYDQTTQTWSQETPLFPSLARAYTTTPVNGGEGGLFVLGGQSYQFPYTYRDAYHLALDGDNWRWDRLPDMKKPRAMFGAAQIGSVLYAQGGTVFDNTFGWDTTIDDVGSRFERLDLNNLDEGWASLPDLPGTKRSHQAVVEVRGKIYVLGGVIQTGGENTTAKQMVDNWRYDPATAAWTRLRDQPFPGESWSALVMEDRYVLMFGGFLGREVVDATGAVIQQQNPEVGFTDRVLVYDTLLDEYFDATPMPRLLADTRVVWLQDGETIYSLTAEVDGSQRIADAYIGHISHLGVGAKSDVTVPEPAMLLQASAAFVLLALRRRAAAAQPGTC